MSRQWRSSVLVLSALLTVGCAHHPPPIIQSSPGNDEAASRAEYALGTGDVFEVRVYGEDELSGKYQVGPDGTIDFPFVGSLRVQGKSGSEVAQEISLALKEGQYLREPHVSVFVEEMSSKRISIVGAVAKPGSLVFVPGMTLVQALSLAGGFTALADRDGTVITRRADGELQKISVPAGRAQRGDAEDVALRPGDIVFVPERFF